MESKEILREFAGKLAGLSAAAKVVAITGAISAYNGTIYAAKSKAVKAENRLVASVASKENPATETKKEETAAAKKTPTYNTKYYRTPGAPKGTPRSSSRSSRSSYSYNTSSSYDYAPTAPSYVEGTSDDSAFGENASTSRRSSSPRNAYRNRRSWNTASTGRTDALSASGLSGAAKDGSADTRSTKTASTNNASITTFSGFGMGGTGGSGSSRVPTEKEKRGAEIVDLIDAKKKKLVDADAVVTNANEEKIEKGLKLVEETERGKILVDRDQIVANNAQPTNANANNAVVPQDATVPTIAGNPVPAQNINNAQAANVQPQAPQNINVQPQANNGAAVAQNNANIPPVPGAIPPPPGALDANGNIIPNGNIPPPPPLAGGIPPVPGGVPPLPMANVIPPIPIDTSIKTDELLETLDKNFEVAKKKAEAEEKKRNAEMLAKEGNLKDIAGKFFEEYKKAGGRDASTGMDGIKKNLAINGYKADIEKAIKSNAGKKTYAFYEGFIRLLATMKSANTDDSNQFDSYKIMLETSCEPILRAVRYFEEHSKDMLRPQWQRCKTEENIPDFIADSYNRGDYYALCADCFKKYNVSLAYVRDMVLRDLAITLIENRCTRNGRDKKDVKFRESQFSDVLKEAETLMAMEGGIMESKDLEPMIKRMDHLHDEIVKIKASFNGVAKDETSIFKPADYAKMAKTLDIMRQAGVAEETDTVANNQEDRGSALDREILQVVGETKKKAWYSDEEIEKMLKESKEKFVEEKDKHGGLAKGQLLRKLGEFATTYMLANVHKDYRNKQMEEAIKVQTKKQNLFVKELKKYKTSKLIKFEEDLRREWNKTVKKFADKPEMFTKGSAFFKEADIKFENVMKEIKKPYKEGLEAYEKQQVYPVISKIRKAVADAENSRLRLKFDDNEKRLIGEQRGLIRKVFAVALPFCRNKAWILDGEWVSENLNILPFKATKVKSVVLQNTSLTGKQLETFNDDNYENKKLPGKIELETIAFKNVEFYGNALKNLKIRNAKLAFTNTKSEYKAYSGNEVLKRLRDEYKNKLFFKNSDWVQENVPPPPPPGVLNAPAAVNKMPPNPGDIHNIGMPVRPDVKAGGVVAGAANLPKPAVADPANGGNANPFGPRKKFGAVNQKPVAIKDAARVNFAALKHVDNKERDAKILEQYEEVWKNDDVDCISVNVAVIVNELYGDIDKILRKAIEYANKGEKPLVLEGKLTDDLTPDSSGKIARELLGLEYENGKFVSKGPERELQTPLKFCFTSNYDQKTISTRRILNSISIMSESHGRDNIKEIEMDRIIPNNEMIDDLSKLKLDRLTLKNLHNSSPDGIGINGWEKGIDLRADSWKKLMINTYVVDLKENVIPNRQLDALKSLIQSINPDNKEGAVDEDNVQPRPRLSELILPETESDVAKTLIDEIQRLVSDLNP